MKITKNVNVDIPITCPLPPTVQATQQQQMSSLYLSLQ